MKHILGLFLSFCVLVAPLSAAGSGTGSGYGPPAPSEAPIAFLMELPSGQTLFAREADRRFLPASITKVMSLYLAFEMLKAGKLAPGQSLTVSEKTFHEWSGKGSSLFLKNGQKVSVDELLQGIATVSANDGCMVLAEGAVGSTERWVALMNAEARQLGMTNSHFGTPNGWPDEGRTYVSARDLARLANALITRHPKLFARYIGHYGMRFNGIAQTNHDPIIGVVEGAEGIKTGFTRQAGYTFLGSARRGERRLVMVVAGIDSDEARRSVSRNFIEWGFTGFEYRRLFPRGKIVGNARVQGGAERKVPLVTAQPIDLSLARSKQADITLSLRYHGPLQAPVKAGEPVAELEVKVAGQGIHYVPLKAAADVPKANLLQRLRNGILGLFS